MVTCFCRSSRDDFGDENLARSFQGRVSETPTHLRPGALPSGRGEACCIPLLSQSGDVMVLTRGPFQAAALANFASQPEL